MKTEAPEAPIAHSWVEMIQGEHEQVYKKHLSKIIRLLQEVHKTSPPTEETIGQFFKNKGVLILQITEDELAGIATLTPIPKINGLVYNLGHVITTVSHMNDRTYAKLVGDALGYAKIAGARCVELSCDESRAQAYALYIDLGFEKRPSHRFRFYFNKRIF